jgi:3',5'-cyclic AMP phosphodiesterase CpdA
MSFSFIQITDHHLPADEADLVRGFSPAYAFRAVLRHIAGSIAPQVDFVVSTGDLAEPSTLATYQAVGCMLALEPENAAPPGPLLTSVEGLQRFPIVLMPGNHDERQPFCQAFFPHSTPLQRYNVTFIHKGVQFICLDWGAETKAVAHPETMLFLEKALQADLPAVILSHHHVTPCGSRWLDEFLADGLERFWEIVTAPQADGKVLGILCGHTHLTYEKLVEGIPVFGTRSTAFPFAHQDEPLITLQPPQYRLVTIQGGVLTTRVFEVRI